ncbi:MAG: hypothetical protein FJ020_03135 [Chloroflexi bacterium]|nr:hypothetical protein [Chloroflexota bacterium]
MDIDTSALKESALLVVVGMAVVFVGLFILMVAATAVVRLSQRNNNGGLAGQTRAVPVPAAEHRERDGEAIAAMAVALALSLQKDRVAPSGVLMGGIPPSGAPAGGTWAAAGREQLMRSRGKVGHKWGRRSE